VNTVSDKGIYWPIYSCKKGSRGISHTWKFGRKWPTSSKTPTSNQYWLVALESRHL